MVFSFTNETFKIKIKFLKKLNLSSFETFLFFLHFLKQFCLFVFLLHNFSNLSMFLWLFYPKTFISGVFLNIFYFSLDIQIEIFEISDFEVHNSKSYVSWSEKIKLLISRSIVINFMSNIVNEIYIIYIKWVV